MKDVASAEQLREIEEIYQQLRTKGSGRERVNDDNVFALIERAEQDGQQILATELREWQAACGVQASTPPGLFKPTPGFNKENVKH